jgi:hypothetical protein
MTDLFHPPLGLHRIRWQQTRQPLVQVEEEGDSFGVRLIRLFAITGFIGFVHGGVLFLFVPVLKNDCLRRLNIT